MMEATASAWKSAPYQQVWATAACQTSMGMPPTVRAPAARAAEDIRAVAAALYNSFERAVPPDSAVWDIESALRAHGALAALLSGSGSAVFGLFAREDTARAAAETLRERWPVTFAAQPV